ncbi:16S rRNA (cytidine(1402)-2'-O)-methyltransferase [Ilumatobacter sp.]|uniref:16S rRNA (cytidine(1402)-2'-O)-methyltransferase n=1 Tax=Ilumatobacter sp. TaxID=1967498 RepID=UPI003B5237EA
MSTLWLVATPIGNLGDLAPRAIEVLASSQLVCCEDTRRTAKLLRHADIRVERLAVCNDHTEFALVHEVLGVLADGGDVAVVSDAGTPGVSDPGERLVSAAIDVGHVVSAVPGPAAATMAVTISGFRGDRWVFEGFLPRSGRDRAERLAEVASESRTVVVYEAPHRIERTIVDLLEVCGPDRRVAISREMTKVHEETVRGRLADIDIGEPRGEYVVVVEGARRAGAPLTDDDVRDALRGALERGSTRRDAAAEVAERTGRRKREVYQLCVELDRDDPRVAVSGGPDPDPGVGEVDPDGATPVAGAT